MLSHSAWAKHYEELNKQGVYDVNDGIYNYKTRKIGTI